MELDESSLALIATWTDMLSAERDAETTETAICQANVSLKSLERSGVALRRLSVYVQSFLMVDWITNL
jgi:hypothetical protein